MYQGYHPQLIRQRYHLFQGWRVKLGLVQDLSILTDLRGIWGVELPIYRGSKLWLVLKSVTFHLHYLPTNRKTSP